jgi:Cdc6-like AAA superfamily ATPase
LNRTVVMNAFLPAAGVDDPHRFAGRKEQIEELSNALFMEGSIPLIYGQRGLGKSSLALQLTRIAQGDVNLLTELELEELVLPGDQRFITFYVNCTDSTKNLKGLLQLMINAVEALKFERAKKDSDDFKLVDKTTRRALSLKFVQLESTRRYEKAVAEFDDSKMSLEERLVRLTNTLTDVYDQRILFVVDELDRLTSVTGLASFLKSHSSNILKFVLVGIGLTEGELLKDHASLTRQLVSVNVPRMTKFELESIVDRTEEYLAENDEPYQFAPSAKSDLARIASGFPWFVHLIGQTALVAVSSKGGSSVEKIDIENVVKLLATTRLARQYYDAYTLAVRDSYPREFVLRLFALWGAEDIPTSGIYPKAKDLGVMAPSNYLGHLTQAQCGSVLVPSPQKSRLYRFSDEMFKVYVRTRPSYYEGVKEQAEATFKKK